MNVFRNRNIIAPTQKELWGGLLCWVAYLIIVPFVLSPLPFFQEDGIRSAFMFELTATVMSFLLVLLVFRKFLFRSQLPFLLLLLTCFFGFLGVRALGSLWGMLLLFLQPLLPETPTNLNQELITTLIETYSGAMVVNVALFTPFIEELLFRGVIFAPICKKSPLWAYIASMTAFAGLHVISYIGMQHWAILLFSFLEYLPAGFVLCWSYQRSQSIWAPIVLHGLLNLFSSVLMLV